MLSQPRYRSIYRESRNKAVFGMILGADGLFSDKTHKDIVMAHIQKAYDEDLVKNDGQPIPLITTDIPKFLMKDTEELEPEDGGQDNEQASDNQDNEQGTQWSRIKERFAVLLSAQLSSEKQNLWRLSNKALADLRSRDDKNSPSDPLDLVDDFLSADISPDSPHTVLPFSHRRSQDGHSMRPFQSQAIVNFVYFLIAHLKCEDIISRHPEGLSCQAIVTALLVVCA
jgi:hypothetical protein